MKVWRLDHPASRWSALKSSLTNYRSSPVMDKYFYSLHQKHDDKKMNELIKTLYWNTIRPGVIHMLFISLGRIWFFRYSPSSGDSRYNFAETIFLKNEINLQDSALKFTPKHKYRHNLMNLLVHNIKLWGDGNDHADGGLPDPDVGVHQEGQRVPGKHFQLMHLYFSLMWYGSQFGTRWKRFTYRQTKYYKKGLYSKTFKMKC